MHADPYDEAIARALLLLPRQPEKVVLVEQPVTTGPHTGKPNVEAFVHQGGRIVHLVRQGVTLQGALKGAGIFDYALACIVWHEMAHIDGADEPTAQRVEEALWSEFILAGRVDKVQGMRYLAFSEEGKLCRPPSAGAFRSMDAEERLQAAAATLLNAVRA